MFLLNAAPLRPHSSVWLKSPRACWRARTPRATRVSHALSLLIGERAAVCIAVLVTLVSRGRYYTLLKREMRLDPTPPTSSVSSAGAQQQQQQQQHMQQHHTFTFVSVEHVLMKRLPSVPDREFVQISCILAVAPPPSEAQARARRLRVTMETSHPRTPPPPPLPGLAWKICDNKFID